MLQRETVLRNHPKTQAVLDRLRVDASAASVAGAPVVVSCGGAAAEEGDDETCARSDLAEACGTPAATSSRSDQQQPDQQHVSKARLEILSLRSELEAAKQRRRRRRQQQH